MNRKFNIIITSVIYILLLTQLCNKPIIISYNNSLMDEINNLKTRPSESFQNSKNDPIAEVTRDNNINMEIQSSAIIIEDSDEFQHGTLDNLVLDNNIHLSIDMRGIWKQKSNPKSTPSPRIGHAMVYDPNTDKLILFGGNNGSNLGDTWVYDIYTNTWTENTPTTSPSGRWLHTLVYDSLTKNVLLFGGYNGIGQYSDLWVYNPTANTWSEKFPSSSPSARYGHSMIHDNNSNKFILYGGRAGVTNYGDTWVYDLTSNSWTQMSPTTSPGIRFEHSMVFNSISSKVILFGGHAGGNDFFDETWVYDYPSNTWTAMNPQVKPPARRSFDMIFDSNYGKALLYGGYGKNAYFQDTWVYDPVNNIWIEESVSVSPGVRWYHAMTFDTNSSRVIAFGGLNSGYLNDMWIYSFYRYFQSGIFQSRLTSLGNIYHIIGDVEWNPKNQPMNTSIIFQIGLSNTSNDIDFQFTQNATTDFSFTGLAQYLRYRVFFVPDINQVYSPSLDTVFIHYFFETPKPMIKIVNPQNNSIINGEITISAMADSPNGIEKVCFYIGGLLIAWDEKTPYLCSWNSTNSINGYVSVIVIATSILGRESIDSIQLYVLNPIEPNPVISAPNPPVDLMAIAGDYFIQLNWSSPENNGGLPIGYYKIYRGTTMSDFILLAISKNTDFKDNNLIAGIAYYYCVSAVNDIGESALSEIVNSTLLGTPDMPKSVPDAPSNISIKTGPNYAVLSWSPPIDDGGLEIIRYNIYRGTSNEAYLFVGVVTSKYTSFNNTLLIGGVTYYYMVTAVNTIGESLFSEEVSGTPTGSTIPKSGTLPNFLFILGFLVVFVVIYRKYNIK